MWLTVINEIFKATSHFDLFCQVNCLYKLQTTQKTQLKNDTYGLVFRLLEKDFVNYRKLTVINEIFKFPPHLGPFFQINYLLELFSGYPSYPI